MTITPYTPAAFPSSIFNPAVGGVGVPFPYVSVSQFQNTPTAMDVKNLLPGAGAVANTQALADILAQASGIADRFCFGADPASKGASLCATLSVETARVPVINKEIRLVCDYRPIIQINGIDIGPDFSTMAGINTSTQASVRIGRQTIYVPFQAYGVRTGDTGNPSPAYQNFWPYMVAVWSYVNGYPHTQLASTANSGQKVVNVQATDGGTGVLGIIPGSTQMTIVDGANTESFVVGSVSGTAITSKTNLLHTHTAPSAPDFIPVTTLPPDVSRAVIFLATVLIKTQGDNSLVLDGIREPRRFQQVSGEQFQDLNMAHQLLVPFKVHVKSKV